jgi:hypothetical protein
LPVNINEPLVVEVQKPNGVKKFITLDRNEEGTYSGIFTDTSLRGAYIITANVSARTPQGHYITRFRQMTGIIFRVRKGGDPGSGTHPGGGGKNDTCCKRLEKKLEELIRVIEKRG